MSTVFGKNTTSTSILMKASTMHTDTLTQIESRLGAALDDLETVREFFIKDDKDDFDRQFTAFDAQEKIENVLYYLRQITHKED